MLRWVVYLAFIVVGIENLFATMNLRQSGAVIKYCNPKYAVNCTAITKRVRRGEPYKTNVSFVTLQPWYNNVTLKISINPKKYGDMFTIHEKICDIGKLKWFKEYLISFSNIPLGCPLAPNRYDCNNMVFPPKDFPLPIPNGDLELIVAIESTETKVLIGEGYVYIHNN